MSTSMNNTNIEMQDTNNESQEQESPSTMNDAHVQLKEVEPKSRNPDEDECGSTDSFGGSDGFDSVGMDDEDSSEDLPNVTETWHAFTDVPMPKLIKLLLLTVTKLRHKITDTAAIDFLKLINICSNAERLPISNYMLKKTFSKLSPAEVHHMCPQCAIYFGMATENPTLTCHSCFNEFNVKNNIQVGNFFMYLNLSDQLKDILENHNIKLCKPDLTEASCSFAGVMDGLQYKKAMKHFDQPISITFSCDGVPAFKRSKYSLWPVLCTINELPHLIQKEKVMIASLWFGVKKPEMSQYLLPFVRECEKLSKEGINVQLDNTIVNLKVSVLIGVCDTVARPMLQNATQFNGRFGCGYCLHPGQVVEKGRGHVRVYPQGDVEFELRNMAQTISFMKDAEKKSEAVNGMKGLSILLMIPNFNIIESLIPDYMHCVLLGVVRQFMALWLDSEHHSKVFYLGPQQKEIDKRFLNIQPPLNISRTPRTIVERSLWKAHEWYCWLLYYSIPVLKGLLPDQNLFHWSLLVHAMYLLLKETILKSEVHQASVMLQKFITLTSTLYGREHVSYNVHMLSHLAKSVSNWGPLWTHSAFVYENYNAELLDFIRSTNGVSSQICDRFRLKCGIPKIAAICLPHMSDVERDYFLSMTTPTKKIVENSTRLSESATALGLAQLQAVGRAHFLSLKRLNVNIPSSEQKVEYLNRIVLRSEVIHSKSYTRVKKRNSYTVLLQDRKSIFSIDTFLLFNSDCFAVGHYFKTAAHNCCRGVTLDHLLSLTYDEQLAAVNVNEILKRVIFFEVENDGVKCAYAVIEPNRLEVTN